MQFFHQVKLLGKVLAIEDPALLGHPNIAHKVMLTWWNMQIKLLVSCNKNCQPFHAGIDGSSWGKEFLALTQEWHTIKGIDQK